MGGHYYSSSARSAKATSDGYFTKSASEIFTQRKIHESLNPKGLVRRECRDSDVHPNSMPIIIGLDVTGSMGKIPHNFIKDGLPTMISTIIEGGCKDAAVCFVAIGDHISDRAPLQVGQFESGDEELDNCLLNTWLEGGGGGGGRETYSLAWLFAGRHTETDAWEKRKQKGFLFTIGDERCWPTITAAEYEKIMGTNPEARVQSADLLAEAQKKYNVYHLYLETGYDCFSEWQERLGDKAIKVDDYTNIPKIIADIVSGVGAGKTETSSKSEEEVL